MLEFMASHRAKGTVRSYRRETELAALVCEVVDEFAVFAVFACEDFFEFEDGPAKLMLGYKSKIDWIKM